MLSFCVWKKDCQENKSGKAELIIITVETLDYLSFGKINYEKHSQTCVIVFSIMRRKSLNGRLSTK